MHIIQKSNNLNIKKKNFWKRDASIEKQATLGGTHPFSGWCFPQRAVTDVDVA